VCKIEIKSFKISETEYLELGSFLLKIVDLLVEQFDLISQILDFLCFIVQLFFHVLNPFFFQVVCFDDKGFETFRTRRDFSFEICQFLFDPGKRFITR
jgi:hypothetical protein